MTMRLEFTAEILKKLNYQRFRHPAPLVQRRMEALWLKAHDLPHAQIAELVDISENMLRDYFELYRQGGGEKLKDLNYDRTESELAAHITSQEAYFREDPTANIIEAQSKIEAVTGVKRSETQIREFLKKLHLCYRKVGMIPA